MIEVVLPAALAGFWAWKVLNDKDGFFRGIHRLLLRGEWGRKWMVCPWCSGAWFALGATFVLNAGESIADTIVMGIAAAAITGLLGSYTFLEED